MTPSDDRELFIPYRSGQNVTISRELLHDTSSLSDAINTLMRETAFNMLHPEYGPRYRRPVLGPVMPEDYIAGVTITLVGDSVSLEAGDSMEDIDPAHLSPDEARSVAAALIRWADRLAS